MQKKIIRCSPYPLKNIQAAKGLIVLKGIGHILKHFSTRKVVNHPKGLMNAPSLHVYNTQLK